MCAVCIPEGSAGPVGSFRSAPSHPCAPTFSPNSFRLIQFRKNVSVTPFVSHSFKTKDLKPFRFTHFQKKGGGPFRIHQSPVTNHESLPVSPLDSALTSKRAPKSFTCNTYKKGGEGEGCPLRVRTRVTNHESPVTSPNSPITTAGGYTRFRLSTVDCQLRAARTSWEPR